MLRITLAVGLLVGVFHFSGAFAGNCYADWSVAAPIVRKQGLATVETLARRAQTEIPGDIVRTTLCEEKDRFVYRLLIRDRKGRLSKKTVDARSPFGR